MSAIAGTLRIDWTQYTAEAGVDDGDGRCIYAFWHGRLFLLVPAFRDRGIVIITAVSWAGEVLSRVLERFGYVTVRGSSRRRGVAALVSMKRALEGGRDGGIALDGPSGPRRRSKGGALTVAQSSGCSIVPVGVSARPAWTVPQTWDRFLMPLPVARCAVVVGRPIPSEVLAGMSTEDLDAVVNAVTDEADRRVRRTV
ncbi:DUF374 domain-containing protein [bacterium]|nr:DUF374 domain-containing protein [bacterium]